MVNWCLSGTDNSIPSIVFFALALSGAFITSEHWPGWVWYIVWIIVGVLTVIFVG
jgi:hypothetical protein